MSIFSVVSLGIKQCNYVIWAVILVFTQKLTVFRLENSCCVHAKTDDPSDSLTP
jgi:hypothetical protein